MLILDRKGDVVHGDVDNQSGTSWVQQLMAHDTEKDMRTECLRLTRSRHMAGPTCAQQQSRRPQRPHLSTTTVNDSVTLTFITLSLFCFGAHHYWLVKS